jgi:hypothetical protein
MVNLIRRGGGFFFGALLSAACGGGADSNAGPEVVPFSGLEPVVAPPPAQAPVNPAPENMEQQAAVTPEAPPVLAPPVAPEPEEPVGCQAPSGVSGTPRNLPEAMALLNALPRPTTLACFLEALDRPLRLYLTSSNQSLQPSPGARSPRVFVVNEPMVLSIVLEGDASETLEIGYRTTQTRSIKTELIFPLQREVTFANLFDGVKDGDGRVTRCSACHTSEMQFFDTNLQAEVYESDLYPPFEVYEVDVEAVRAENESCDATAEPERCELLSAIFDHGDVVPAPNGISFDVTN